MISCKHARFFMQKAARRQGKSKIGCGWVCREVLRNEPQGGIAVKYYDQNQPKKLEVLRPAVSSGMVADLSGPDAMPHLFGGFSGAVSPRSLPGAEKTGTKTRSRVSSHMGSVAGCDCRNTPEPVHDQRLAGFPRDGSFRRSGSGRFHPCPRPPTARKRPARREIP